MDSCHFSETRFPTPRIASLQDMLATGRYLACDSLFVSLVPPVLVKCDMLDDHCYKAFIAKFAAKGFSLGCYFFLLVCVCVCVPALRVCCSLCLVIVAGIVWGLVCPHICCAWIGWDWGRCCFGVCVVCVGCLSQVIFCVFVKSVVFTRESLLGAVDVVPWQGAIVL